MLPRSKLDDKSFSQLVEEAKKLIPQYTTEWTDHNKHDPGITFIELFSWLTEMQHFYMDRIREENVLKFLKLLGTKPIDTKSSRVDVTFLLNTEKNVRIPMGTKLSAGEIIFETEESVLAISAKLEKIISFSLSGRLEHTTANCMGEFSYYAFGEEAETGSRMYLGFNDSFPEEEHIHVTFNLFEDYYVPIKRHSDEGHVVENSGCLVWEYFSEHNGGKWIPLTIIKDETHMLSQSGRLIFLAPRGMKKYKVHPADDRGRYWIRSVVVKSGYELPPKINSIMLNTISAIQRNTQYEEVGSSNGLPNQIFPLQHFPIVRETIELQVNERISSEFKWKDWIRVDDFDASKPDDQHFVICTETGQVFFGDGINGAIPATPDKDGEKNIRISYQATDGRRGNIVSEAISKILDQFKNSEMVRVKNLLPALGGTQKETLDEAVMRIRRELKSGYRAVTSEDFESLALATPGLRVARAKAFPFIGPPDFTSTKKQPLVTVVIVPFSNASKPVPSQGFLKTVQCHLDKHRLITTQVHVISPNYVKIDVEALLSIKSGADPIETSKCVKEILDKFLNPLARKREEREWPFGRAVYKSEIYEVIKKVPEVECVQKLQIIGEGIGTKHNNGNIEMPRISLVVSGEHTIEIVSSEIECRKNGGI
ncbi:putative baseplate assembly protein [Bacillus toyonensis]|uniref:putative baseplate assembly protein n=1 Tax=Bacillus toyonensis TaxID=155322 RepID=UPI001C02621D|nr:putative baseplate assembly protein [Bacillus toyonensis]QWH88428.1 putative baseplate assembly protein [Bacillus toyonensis]QWI31603.1 putative baseplate assembly protein [Bacillus toyonensis]